jgi:hypothetical protein
LIVSDSEARTLLLRRLHRVAERLPNGLLFRLVEDAVFFAEWNQRKKGARRSARLSQARAHEVQADERYWKEMRKRYGG